MKKLMFLLLLTGFFYSCETDKTLYIADHYGSCEQHCLLVRENNGQDWTEFTGTIDGFTYEEGYSYQIKVRVHSENKQLKYTLLKLISKTKSDEKPILPGLWTVSKIADFKLPKDKKPVFSVADGVIRGNSGCNSFTGVVQTDIKGAFKVSNIRTTRMFCETYDAMERAFHAVLHKTVRYSIKNDALLLFDADARLLLAAEQAQKTTGLEAQTWYISSIRGFQNTSGKKVSFSVKNGQINGNDTCNDFSGSIQTDAQGGFKTGNLQKTKRYCAETAALATAFYRALSEVKSYEIKDKTLMLYDASHYIVLTAKTDTQTAENEEESNYNITYVKNNIRFTEKFYVDIENQSLTYSNSQTGIHSKVKLTDKQLKPLISVLEQTDFSKYNYKSKKFPPGQNTGYLNIRMPEKRFQTALFPTNNPPKDLQKVLEQINRLLPK